METLHPTQLPVAPRDCALALTIPLTCEQFLADLGQPDRKDFAAHIRRLHNQQRVTDTFYWHAVYAPVAHSVEAVCRRVEKLGVTVQRAARFNDFTNLVKQFPVVTLVAHWKFRQVEPHDILDGRGLMAELEAPEDRVRQAVRQEIAKRCPYLLDNATLRHMSHSDLQRQVAETINDIIKENHRLYQRSHHRSHKGDVQSENLLVGPLERLTRVAFEEAFPQQLAIRPAVEFFDGLRSVADVIDTVPADFSGVLDLTVCNSVILGSAIKRRRPHCLVVVNRYPTELHIRLGLYRFVIQTLACRPAPFIDVLTQLHTQGRR